MISSCWVDSIEKVPCEVWDEKIAKGHPMKTSAFLKCVERCFPERCYAYLKVFHDERLVGLAALSCERFDLTLLMPDTIARWIRRFWRNILTIRLAMVGTMETVQQHWWFNPDTIDAEHFATLIIDTAAQAFSAPSLLIVRDFTAAESLDAQLQSAFCKQGFAAALNLPLAVIRLDGLSLDQHYGRLRSKLRHTVRRALAAAQTEQLVIARQRMTTTLIDECYPLYLQVHAAAKEFKRNAMPKAFLVAISELPTTSITTARDSNGRLLAFLLSGMSEAVCNPYLIGMDYTCSRDLSLYYNLHWYEFQQASGRHVPEIDLGLTNYFVKQNLGALLQPMTMMARFQKPWLRWFNACLPLLLNHKQPEQRRPFTS